MQPSLKKIALASALLLFLALTITPVTAFAAPLTHATASDLAPLGKTCPPGWHYDDLINEHSNFKAVTSLYGQKNSNTTPYLPVTFTATTGGTVTFTTSKDTGGGANFLFLTVKHDVNSAVSESLTTTVGHAISFHVKPGQTVYAHYGVEQQIVDGHYYYVTSTCQITPDYGYVTTYSPWYATWNYWCVNPSTCYAG